MTHLNVDLCDVYVQVSLVCNSVCRRWPKLVTEPSSGEVGTANFLKTFAVGFHLLTTLFSQVPPAHDKVVHQKVQKKNANKHPSRNINDRSVAENWQ